MAPRRLAVAMACRPATPAPITNTRAGDALVVELVDSGEGIDAADLPHLFDRFYRTDRSRNRDTGGSGLGLAIVRSLVEAQGGSVVAYSAGLGQGSTFRVWFPLVSGGVEPHYPVTGAL